MCFKVADYVPSYPPLATCILTNTSACTLLWLDTSDPSQWIDSLRHLWDVDLTLAIQYSFHVGKQPQLML